MSKSILIMDTPETCLDCRFVREINEGIEACCEIMDEPQDDTLRRMIEVDYCQEKPRWCPLKEAPHKKTGNRYRNPLKSWINGWNACIDEILKE